jgi:hypothetical protein
MDTDTTTRSSIATDPANSPAAKNRHNPGMENTRYALDLPDLAAAIGANTRSLRNAFYLRPEDFPPAIYLPGCRGPRFLVADVHFWLESRKPVKAQQPTVVALKARGRPRKASPAQIARASKAQGGAA